MSTSPLFFDAYVINNLKGDSFLDLGCGYGKWGYLLKKCRDLNAKERFVSGIDIYEPHVEHLRKEGIYDEVKVAKATEIPYGDKSFDCVIAGEIIEHLDKSEGKVLMKELKRVARSAFVVTTPNFSFLRGPGETMDGLNAYESHRCNYSYREFLELGFTQVIGLGRLQIRPWRLGVALSSIGLYWPRLSRYLMGFWFADGRKRQLYAD